jgi:hypothetical protein
MGVRTRVAGKAIAAMVGCAWLLGCGDSSAGPGTVSSDWPYLTTVASTNVAVTATNEPLVSLPGALRVSARFINPGADSVQVRQGSCSFGLRLREVNGRALMPVVWENRPEACTLILRAYVVPPASLLDVPVGTVKPSDFRGVIPPGDYWVNVIWRRYPSADLLEVNAGTLVVP